METNQRLKTLSKDQQKSISGGGFAGGGSCAAGHHHACRLTQNSCGGAQTVDWCNCEDASWNCADDYNHCTTICV